MRNGAPPWTEQDQARFLELRSQGKGVAEIAQAMGRSALAIKHRAHKAIKAGIVERQQSRMEWTTKEQRIVEARRRAGASAREIAAELGRTVRSVLDRMAALGVPGEHRLYTTREEATIRRMLADGWAVDVVASTIKRDPDALRRKIARMRLSTKGCRKRVSGGA